MASAKEIKAYAAAHSVTNAEARKALIEQEANAPVVVPEETKLSEAEASENTRALAKSDDTIALGLVVEKRSSGKPGPGLPKIKKNTPFFRIDVTIEEIEAMASAARHSMPGITMDDIVFIIGDGLKEDAHLENGEHFAAILSAYITGTDVITQLKEGARDVNCKGVIIRVISYKDGYIIRPADYIRSYAAVDQTFAKMKIQKSSPV